MKQTRYRTTDDSPIGRALLRKLRAKKKSPSFVVKLDLEAEDSLNATVCTARGWAQPPGGFLFHELAVRNGIFHAERFLILLIFPVPFGNRLVGFCQTFRWQRVRTKIAPQAFNRERR